MVSSKNIPDVCIIGAGLAGALVAYEMASKGAKVIVLESGPRHDPQDRFLYMEERLRNNKDPWASNLSERDVYTNAGEISYPLQKARVKAVGGTTLRWGGLALRMHETDFRMKYLYGLAQDWPITYNDLEPYYGKAEVALGVAGIADNPFGSYRSTDYPLPPFPFSYDDRLFKKACGKLGMVMHHVPWARNSIPYQNAPACQAFATCGSHRICPISAQYSAERHVWSAEQTGNAQITPNSTVLRINAGKSGRVQSVTYATPDKKEHEQRAQVFVVAAHAIESARLLLLSESSQFPHGLANRSGMVGKNFMDHLYVGVQAKFKQKVFPYRIGFHTAESHQFIPSKNRDEIGSIKLEFDIHTGPKPRRIASKSGHWGTDLSEEVRESFRRHALIAIELEQLPDTNNSITLDPAVKDYFGLPAPRITYSIGNYEKATAEKGIEIGERIFEALDTAEITRGGSASMENMAFGYHHMGTCRMGNDPETSVVNSNLRTHDVENLFVVGSSVFVTGGDVQPSLTIAALAIRAADHIRKGLS